MSPAPPLYDAAELSAALRSVGVKEGDTVFTHVGMGMLGFPREGAAEEAMYRVGRDAFLSVLGPGGTLFAPAYSYSFCRGSDFDPEKTPSTAGPFADRFWREPGAVRSLDPIFSVGGLGPAAQVILAGLPWDCFGADSFFDRLLRAGGKLCNIGVGLRFATYIHYVEQREAVPYRYLKRFPGWVSVNGRRERQEWLYNVHPLVDNALPDLRRLEAAARGSFGSARVGRGEVTCIRCEDMDRFCVEGIRKDPWFLAKGPAIDLQAAELSRAGYAASTAAMLKGSVKAGVRATRPEALLRALAPLAAHPLSPESEAVQAALCAGLPAKTLSCPSGTRVGRTVVPERWLCRDASLSSAAPLSTGTGVPASWRGSPLQASYYSAPCDVELDLRELKDRLRVHAIPGAVPLAAEPDHLHWSLCVSRDFRDRLAPGRYRVRVDAAHLFGRMALSEVLVEGSTRELVVIAVRPDHRGMANDALSGTVAACLALRRRLSAPGPQSVLLLLAPRPWGLSWYLQSRPEIARRAAALILVESMGFAAEPVLQYPRKPEGPWHSAVLSSMREAAPGLREAQGESAWLSAADLKALPEGIPVCCLNRSVEPLNRAAPYPGFRTSLETPSLVSSRHLEESVHMLARFLTRLDAYAGRWGA